MAILKIVGIIMETIQQKNQSNEATAAPRTSQKKKDSTYVVIFTFIVILLCGFFISYILFFSKISHGKKYTQQDSTTYANPTVTMPPERILLSPPNPNNGALQNTVVYASDEAAGYSAKVTRVALNPPVVGDPPDNGYAYLEVDLSITNSGSKNGPIPGVFYFESSQAAYLNAVTISKDRAGKIGGYVTKSVSLPGKQSVYATTLNPGQTLDNLYLIFQINQVKSGDHGHLEWDNGGDAKTNKLYGFYALF